MTSLGVLQDWFDLAEDDAIKVDTDAVNAEAMANMWVFSPNEEKTQLVTADMLTSFLMQIAQRRREQLTRDYAGHPMFFYCWHDAQTRQLRFSLVSQAHGHLPFRCAVCETGDLHAVVDHILNRDWKKAQPADDDVECASVAPQADRCLQVFLERLP